MAIFMAGENNLAITAVRLIFKFLKTELGANMDIWRRLNYDRR